MRRFVVVVVGALFCLPLLIGSIASAQTPTTSHASTGPDYIGGPKVEQINFPVTIIDSQGAGSETVYQTNMGEQCYSTFPNGYNGVVNCEIWEYVETQTFIVSWYTIEGSLQGEYSQGYSENSQGVLTKTSGGGT